MKDFHFSPLLMLVSVLMISVNASAQTLQSNDVVISTLLPDLLTGRHNGGVEYFLPARKPQSDVRFSLAVNAGRYALLKVNDHPVNGVDMTVAFNAYSETLMSSRWNEFVGLKMGFGGFRYRESGHQYHSFFAGLSSGMQPLIAKRIALKIYSDVGYLRNGHSRFVFADERFNQVITRWVVQFNLGAGWRL